MKKKAVLDIEKASKQIIKEASKLDIDEKYRIGVFSALLTRALSRRDDGASIEEPSKQTKAQKSKPLSLPGRIIKMRDRGYFKESKSDLEVHSQISKDYKCSRDRVTMALLRLVRRHELRRTEKSQNGRKVVAYAW